MSRHITLSASLLSADFGHLEQQIRQAEDGGIDWFHLDVMDGHFVPNISMGPFIVETVRQLTSRPLDVHLMISDPGAYIDAFADAGADYIGVHIENQPHVHRLLERIHQRGCKAVMVINPGTAETALEAILSETDMVLVMSVNPGYSGQGFIDTSTAKITRIASLINRLGLSVPIQVDGGISDKTIGRCADAGATHFVSASYIYKHPQGIAEAIASLRQAAG